MVNKSFFVKYAKYAASIVIGAGLMFVLNRYINIPTGVPYTSVQLGIPILAVFAAVMGPLAGFLIGFIGHALVDLTGEWGVWWSWVISSAFFGFTVGLFHKSFRIEEGKFGVKQAFIFNGIQAVANIMAYVFIARILDLFMYDQQFEQISLQSFVAAGVNIAAVLILGTILAAGYSKTLTKTGRQKNYIEDLGMDYSKRINNLAKAVAVRIILGMFFISSLMTLLISEMVSRQTDNYRTTVTEVTEHHLISAVTALSHLISAEELDLFHTVEDMNTIAYEEVRKQLIKFAEENAVKYAYYWRDYGDGTHQYIVDND
ncbi:MAG: ECF-type riboflavin transporter substrate-binding protein, partial [Treponema sp.]|nr:ECF-type riboflavin transporter substrate-binding protein [Treponema sp.]